MEIPTEQTEQIKKQLIQQINSTFPEDKKASAIQQIEAMNAEQLKEFLIQNKLIKIPKGGGSRGEGGGTDEFSQCIFCSIADEKIPSYKIAENNQAIAILELNPISAGHSLIIPKLHVKEKEIHKEAFSLADEVSKILNEKLKPKKVLIKNSEIMGHRIINLIPVYENEKIDSPRKQAKPEELIQLQKVLTAKPELEKQEITEAKLEEDDYLELPKRIP